MAVTPACAPMNPLDIASHGPVIPVIVIDRVEDALPLAEALLAGGVKVLDGDIVRVDAVAGTLDVLVDAATWAARTPAPYSAPAQTGFGRELFTNFRRHAGGAEQGACTWL